MDPSEFKRTNNKYDVTIIFGKQFRAALSWRNWISIHGNKKRTSGFGTSSLSCLKQVLEKKCSKNYKSTLIVGNLYMYRSYCWYFLAEGFNIQFQRLASTITPIEQPFIKVVQRIIETRKAHGLAHWIGCILRLFHTRLLTPGVCAEGCHRYRSVHVHTCIYTFVHVLWVHVPWNCMLAVHWFLY